MLNNIIEPVSATRPEYFAVFDGPNLKEILSPISLMANMHIEKKPYSLDAALPSLILKTLIRKIALQSATAPSPSEAKKVINATASRGPLGNDMKGANFYLFLSF